MDEEHPLVKRILELTFENLFSDRDRQQVERVDSQQGKQTKDRGEPGAQSGVNGLRSGTPRLSAILIGVFILITHEESITPAVLNENSGKSNFGFG